MGGFSARVSCCARDGRGRGVSWKVMAVARISMLQSGAKKEKIFFLALGLVCFISSTRIRQQGPMSRLAGGYCL